MRRTLVAALAVLAGAAACSPQAPGSPSAKGAYPVAVSNTGAQSCYLSYQKRRDLPVTRVGYVAAGEVLDFTVRDPDSRSLTLFAACGNDGYSRLMRLVAGDTLKLEVPSMFRAMRASPRARSAETRNPESSTNRARPRQEGAPQTKGSP